MAVTAETGNRRIRVAAVVVLVLLGVVVLADLAYGAAILLTREPSPRPLTGQRIFHASRPAIVLVQSVYTVKASLPDADLPAAKQTDITNQLIAMVRSGQLPLDESRVDQAAFDIIASNPDAYFAPASSRIDDSFTVYASGTGFFVTGDGYLVTASHVVAATRDDLKAEVLDQEKQPTAQGEIRDSIRKSIQEAGFSASDAQLDRLSSWYTSWETRYLSLDSVDTKYLVGSGANVQAGDALDTLGISASLVKAEPVYPKRDVALLKADVHNVPALPLAAGNTHAGQDDYVIGYPRKEYLEDAAPFNAAVPIVLTSGHVRGRVDRGDWSAIGTDAVVSHGNSGGPVLDGRGDVLGMVSFGTDASGGAPPENYFIPADVVRQLMDSAGVKPNPGTATRTYYRALAEGDAGHYRHEAPLLQPLADRATDAYATDDLVAAQSAIRSGKDRTPPALLPYWPIAAGVSAGALLLALVAAAAWLLAARRPAVLRPGEESSA
jgi:serine protease Do